MFVFQTISGISRMVLVWRGQSRRALFEAHAEKVFRKINCRSGRQAFGDWAPPPLRVKGLKHISDIRADHDWRAAAGGFQFLPFRKGILARCFHDFEREIGHSLRAPLGALLGEMRFSLHNRRSRPFSKYSAQAGGSTEVRA